jgi:hypothetical protein
MENDSIRSVGSDTLVDIWIDGKMRSLSVSLEAIGAFLGFDKASSMSERDRCEFIRTHLPVVVAAAKQRLSETDRSAGEVVIDVGQIPFNFQISKAERDGIRFRAPATPAGEFEVRAGGCDGERVAVLPLAPARANPGVTRLLAPISPRNGREDLCITYTANGVNPMWAIDRVELLTQ